MVGGDDPFHLKFAPKVTHPLQESRFRRISASAVRASKKVQLSRTGSRPRDFQRAIDEVRTSLLTPPKGGSKKRICRLKTDSIIFP